MPEEMIGPGWRTVGRTETLRLNLEVGLEFQGELGLQIW